MQQYNIIADQEETTVVSNYIAPERDDSSYQSEAQLEAWLIARLQKQGYDYPAIHSEAELLANMRVQLGKLNGISFSDGEWTKLLDKISSETLTMEDKSEMIQRENTAISLELDNGEKKNIHLLDKKSIHNNTVQVINQYVPEGGTHANRYDVTILVNGLPLVQIELKRRGVSIREAFNQINRYQRESFWAGKGMFDYIQIFVISNGTETKYYSNSTRYAREKENNGQKGGKKVQSNSFEFTSYWSDRENNLIVALEDFAQTFLTKHTLLSILTKYCVFTVDKNLMVMRPYQIAATEQILLRIQTALYNKWQGSIKAGGYIWHTTGSGKTLTSFKTAQLATKIEGVEKVLFVVDRQDLDYQTMKEYDHFKPGCANGNANSNILLQQLGDASAHIIITTIQKLSSLLRKKKIPQEILMQNFVFIFDECHRSQFGEMHGLITKSFKKYMMFGFTGTPIFSVNAGNFGKGATTTAQVFGGEIDQKGNHTRPLHNYTIINAINDKNVLKFNVEYRAFKAKSDGTESKDYMNDRRLAQNVRYLLRNFDIKTKASETFAMAKLLNVSDVVRNFRLTKERQKEESKQKLSVRGFNSILACDSVPMAMAYYKELERQMAEPDAKKLTMAIIFTTQANEAENEATGNIEENCDDVSMMDASSKDFLEKCIGKYNDHFGTNYDTSSEKFQNYYKDISLRMKNRDIDLLIVVGMFLTGFDAKCLNTLWVDKNLKLHGLLQAFSRTNRILNAVKNCGNIVCFRNLEEQTNASFALFGDKDANGIVIMKKFKDYYNGFDEEEEGKGMVHNYGYKELVEHLQEQYPVSEMNPHLSETSKKDFCKVFGQYLRAYNLLSSFDEFNPEDVEEQKAVRILTEGQRQDYTSWYISFHDALKQGGGSESRIVSESKSTEQGVEEDIEFEMDLVRQVQIDIPFILALVKKYHESNCKDHEIMLQITRGITSSPDLRKRKDLITGYIDTIQPGIDIDVYDEWDKYIREAKEKALEDIIKSENLKPEETRRFIEKSMADGYVEENGTAIIGILPPMPIFGGGNIREKKKQSVIGKIKGYIDRFLDI